MCATVAIGTLLAVRLWTGEPPSLTAVIIVGLACGFSILPIIGYLVILSVGFSAAAICIALALTLAFVVALQIWSPKGGIERIRPAIGRESVYGLLLPLVISLFSLLLRLNAVLIEEPLPEVDPWFWLYHTRVLLATGGIDYSLAGAYPLGFVLLTSLISADTPTYQVVYGVIRFIGPALSAVTTFAVYRATLKCFGGQWRVASIASLGFAVGNLLQFRGRLATPETEALLLFVVFLSYVYIYEQRSVPLTALLLAGLVAVHPTTALVAFGIWMLSEIRRPHRSTIVADARGVARYCVTVVLLLSPLLVALLMNTDLIARYGFYGESMLSDQGGTALAIVRDSLNSLVTYSLGPVLFGVSLVGVSRYLLGPRKSKWAYIGWGVCVLWALSAFIPILFFRVGAPRAATFIVFPAMIIIGHVYVGLEDTVTSSSVETPLLRSGSAKKAMVFLLIISAQLFYGCSYDYSGHRYISTTGLDTLEWIAGSNIRADSVYVYDSWVNLGSTNIAQAVLYPLPSFANDTLRSGSWSAAMKYIDSHGARIFVVVTANEPLYQYLIAAGNLEVYNNAGMSVVLYNRL